METRLKADERASARRGGGGSGYAVVEIRLKGGDVRTSHHGNPPEGIRKPSKGVGEGMSGRAVTETRLEACAN